jgi:hypothetical protein
MIYSFYIDEFFLKIKNIYNIYNIEYYYLLFYSIYLICIYFYYCLIEVINKLRKHNQINISSYKIKYLDLYLSFDFFNFIFSYRLFFLFTLGFLFI